MLFGIGYLLEDQEKAWKQYLEFHRLRPLTISEEQLLSVRETLYEKCKKDILKHEQFLVEGVYFNFVTEFTTGDMLLEMRGNSEEKMQGLSKKLNPPFNKPNLSAKFNPKKLLENSERIQECIQNHTKAKEKINRPGHPAP